MPYLALLFNALVWGLSWWPLRQLQAQGLHPLWATLLFFLLGGLLIGVSQPQAGAPGGRTPAPGVRALACGATHAEINWGVSTGEVVRAALLADLTPLWALGRAGWGLGDRVSGMAGGRGSLALCGALLVLRPAEGGWPAFSGLADWLGLLGGMGFAITNVMLRRQSGQPASARALAMFLGGITLPAALGAVLASQALIPHWPPLQVAWLLPALALGTLFFVGNMALQYGASRLPVHITSVVMLTEVLFAASSAVWLGGEVLRPSILAGGALIMAAALMASRDQA